MITESGKRSTTEPPERQNPLISEDPLKIELAAGPSDVDLYATPP